ncbi:hypothetical protein [Carnobacterium maltaromaticum]|uniref:hypothetical protein n=1 Tax=Carnobacterium maltaromaticum TaxID=2751 RepID=UPI00295E8D98|nr:hypothetical protein [Carnobacterium maltaromaticum]
MQRKNLEEKLISISNETYIVIETTKPIMLIKYERSEFVIIYLTQDKLLKKNNKSLFFQEYLAGKPKLEELLEFIENKVSVYNFLENLSDKSRIVKANSKVFPSQSTKSFSTFKKSLPKESISIKSMPVNSCLSINKLKKVVNFEIDIKNNYNDTSNEIQTKYCFNKTEKFEFPSILLEEDNNTNEDSKYFFEGSSIFEL